MTRANKHTQDPEMPVLGLPITRPLALQNLSSAHPNPVDIAADAAECTDMAAFLEVEAVERARLVGELTALPAGGWRFTGRLTARLLQRCVVTLDSVPEEIDIAAAREFLPGLEEPDDLPAEMEIDLGEGDPPDPLTDPIELGGLMVELIALNMAEYPRSADAEFGSQVYAGPGVTPLTDEAMRPFAKLATLKEKLDGGA